MSRYVVEDFASSDITDIAIILGDLFPQKVREYYGDGSKFGVKITYIEQGKPAGISQAIGLCKDFVGHDKFVVYLGDNILKGGIGQFVKRFRSSQSDAMILLCEVKDPSRYGIATVGDNGLERIVEKPKDSASNLAVIGIYFLSPSIFPIIEKLTPSARGELEVTDALQKLLESGERIEFDYVTEWWKDTGTPEDIIDANRFILDTIKSEIRGSVESGESIQGRVVIGTDSIIEKGAIIRGPVIIGKRSHVKEGVYIGPYTSIGDNVVIRNAEIENSIILNGCKILAHTRIVDSIIGNNTIVEENGRIQPKGTRLVVGDGSTIKL